MADTANKQQLWQSRIEECQNSLYIFILDKKTPISIGVRTENYSRESSLCTASIGTGYSECSAKNGSPGIYVPWNSSH